MQATVSLDERARTVLKKKKVQHGKYTLFLMALPFLLLAFIFSYVPLYGWIYAFYDFQPAIPLSQTPYVGFHWFAAMFSNATERQEMVRVLRNTFAISSLGLLTSFFPLIFALFLAEIRTVWFKKMVQTLTTLPNFISWVLVYSFAFMLFSVDNGFVNHLLMQLHLISKPINFLASDSHTWLEMTFWGMWKGLGWGAVLYIAAMTGIDEEQYEAARVDGAGRFRLMWNITLPGLLPTYFVLLILGIANFINNGIDQYFVFGNAMNMNHIEVLDLYVYNLGFTNGQEYSFATAVGMMKSLVSVFLLFVMNNFSKWVRGESVV